MSQNSRLPPPPDKVIAHSCRGRRPNCAQSSRVLARRKITKLPFGWNHNHHAGICAAGGEIVLIQMVAAAGLEPALGIPEADFKSAVSTNSTTRPERALCDVGGLYAMNRTHCKAII